SLPFSKIFLTDLGKRSGFFEIEIADDLSKINLENDNSYGAVIFYTIGELPISAAQKDALLNLIRAGVGFLGIHSATATFQTWLDVQVSLGGRFDGHPWHQTVKIDVVEPSDPIVSFLDAPVEIRDEIYQIKDFDAPGSRVLLRLDEASVNLSAPGVRRRP